VKKEDEGGERIGGEKRKEGRRTKTIFLGKKSAYFMKLRYFLCATIFPRLTQ